MNLACKKILGKFTKVLGFGKTPPPCWENFPNNIVFSFWERTLWNWNLIKIFVGNCDMNSTLGSVVLLALFFTIVCNAWKSRFHNTLSRENHDLPSRFRRKLRFCSKPANEEPMFECWDESSGSLRSSQYGLVSFGMIWFGMVWFDLVSLVWKVWFCRFGLVGLVW